MPLMPSSYCPVILELLLKLLKLEVLPSIVHELFIKVFTTQDEHLHKERTN